MIRQVLRWQLLEIGGMGWEEKNSRKLMKARNYEKVILSYGDCVLHRILSVSQSDS